MALTPSVERSTLAIRIRNGQTSTGAWKYTNVNLAHVKAGFDSASGSQDLSKANAIYVASANVLVGTRDGMRLVNTVGLAFSE